MVSQNALLILQPALTKQWKQTIKCSSCELRRNGHHKDAPCTLWSSIWSINWSCFWYVLVPDNGTAGFISRSFSIALRGAMSMFPGSTFRGSMFTRFNVALVRCSQVSMFPRLDVPENLNPSQNRQRFTVIFLETLNPWNNEACTHRQPLK